MDPRFGGNKPRQPWPNTQQQRSTRSSATSASTSPKTPQTPQQMRNLVSNVHQNLTTSTNNNNRPSIPYHQSSSSPARVPLTQTQPSNVQQPRNNPTTSNQQQQQQIRVPVPPKMVPPPTITSSPSVVASHAMSNNSQISITPVQHAPKTSYVHQQSPSSASKATTTPGIRNEVLGAASIVSVNRTSSSSTTVTSGGQTFQPSNASNVKFTVKKIDELMSKHHQASESSCTQQLLVKIKEEPVDHLDEDVVTNDALMRACNDVSRAFDPKPSSEQLVDLEPDAETPPPSTEKSVEKEPSEATDKSKPKESSTSSNSKQAPSTSSASTEQTNEAVTSSSSESDKSNNNNKRKANDDKPSPAAEPKKPRVEQTEMDFEDFLKPWICSRAKVAVSYKDYPKTLMTQQAFETFEDMTLAMMGNSMDSEEQLPTASIALKAGAAVFYCNNADSKDCWVKLLSKDKNFLESRNMKILEEDEVPGSMRIIGCFMRAKQPREAVKMLGKQHSKDLDVTRWIIEKSFKRNWGLELILGIDQQSLTFLRAEKFCLPFGLRRVYFRGGREIYGLMLDSSNNSEETAVEANSAAEPIAWNDQLEDMRMVEVELIETAAKNPAQNYWKHLERYHSCLLNGEIKKLRHSNNEN